LNQNFTKVLKYEENDTAQFWKNDKNRNLIMGTYFLVGTATIDVKHSKNEKKVENYSYFEYLRFNKTL